jgi:putative Ca2+/H+ antiporter (TMEM165/GDT1 family)
VAGRLLALLPHRALEAVVGGLFVVGAVMLLLHKEDDEEEAEGRTPRSDSFWRVAGASFVVIAIAEFGDLTQIATANLAAKYGDWLAVGLGSWLALCAVSGLAILGGQKLMQRVPLHVIQRCAAAIMLVLAGISIANAIRG